MSKTWLEAANKRLANMPDEAREIRETALEDLYFFARLVNPGYVYGSIHRNLFKWLEEYSIFGQGDELSSNKLIMLPRAHLKSHMVANRAAEIITRHPVISIIYFFITSVYDETYS